MNQKKFEHWNMLINEPTKEYSRGDATGKKAVKKKRKLGKYYLGEKFKDIYFTQKEAECMALFLKGKTVATAAEILKLSSRTAEYYLNNMKQKLNCPTKSDLIFLVSGSDFLNNLKNRKN
jgi:DNA-binding CsgD family transcriptional regulator